MENKDTSKIFTNIENNLKAASELLEKLIDVPKYETIERKNIYICAPYNEKGDLRKQYSSILDYKRMIFCDYDSIPISLHLYDPSKKLKEQVISLCDEMWVFDKVDSTMLEEISIANKFNKTIRTATKDGV